MKEILEQLKQQLWEIFNPLPDKDNEALIVQSIKDDVEFKGVRIWILICAIFTASLGLNVNSTAVIIGAMLISPLMNPIVGLGLGLAIYDIALVRRSFRSLAIMVLISITTATIYFAISPLSQAQSELLARTQPTIYDVLIAVVGGAAGILANSSKIKGNILMGVAIATALMPPLCTAGYGISQGSLSYFLGASYLFTINAIFIALSTLVVVRAMKFSPVAFFSPEREKKIHRWIVGIIICVVTPSIYSGLTLVKGSIQEDAINRFVRDYLNTSNYQTLRHHLIKTDSIDYLEVALLGKRLDSLELDSLERLMQSKYNLNELGLLIRQDFMTSIDSSNLSLSRDILNKQMYDKQDELLRHKQEERDSLAHILQEEQAQTAHLRSSEQELLALYPELGACRIASISLDGDRLYIISYKGRDELTATDKARIASWLATRMGVGAKAISFHKL